MRSIARSILNTTVMALALATGSAAIAEPVRAVAVATYNQYLGGDLAPLVAATTPAEFNAALVGVLRQVASNRFPARARRQAALTDRAQPALVGLQEVWRYRCRDLPPAPGACADPSIRSAFVDQLALTLAALNQKRPRYRLAAEVRNFDTEEVALSTPLGTVRGLPFVIDGKAGLLLAGDRDVILAREGIATAPLTFPGCQVSADGCTYHTILELPLPLGASIAFKRGFVGVEARVAGARHRFVTTHLEIQAPLLSNPLSMLFQSAQAAELIARLGGLPADGSRLVLAGDFNSAPSDTSPAPGIVPPYRQLAAAGYLDAWTSARGAAPGFSCCQAADLRNQRSLLSGRIDLILSRSSPLFVRAIERLGENPADRTDTLPYRLWPSDHAGLAARLQF
ncbi:MAG: endonuclease/exonuclease/phosphatase family protein [Geminicoccaceae bacterium]